MCIDYNYYLGVNISIYSLICLVHDPTYEEWLDVTTSHTGVLEKVTLFGRTELKQTESYHWNGLSSCIIIEKLSLWKELQTMCKRIAEQ